MLVQGLFVAGGAHTCNMKKVYVFNFSQLLNHISDNFTLKKYMWLNIFIIFTYCRRNYQGEHRILTRLQMAESITWQYSPQEAATLGEKKTQTHTPTKCKTLRVSATGYLIFSKFNNAYSWSIVSL